VLIDLSRAAYGMLFGQLGGKAWVSAYFSDPYTFGVDSAPVVTNPLPGDSLTAPPTVTLQPGPVVPAAPLPVAVATRAPPTPAPPNTIAVPSH
jgi:hypothetical protein